MFINDPDEPESLYYLSYVYKYFFLLHHLHAWCPSWSEKGVRSLGTGVTGDCELLCGCWALSPGTLQEQEVFLIAKPYLQHPLDEENVKHTGQDG